MTAKVYVGGSNDRVWRYYRENRDDWSFVRQHADGWYINNFALSKAMRQPNIDDVLRGTADKLTNKNVFFETDLEHSSDAADQRTIEILSSHFNVTNCCINRAHK